MYPESLANLIDFFKKLPGIGEKTARRLAFAVLDFDKEEINEFSEVIIKAKNNIKYCEICGSLTDHKICYVCNDQTREKNVLLVVEDPKDVFVFEEIGNFSGHYHVLGGLISPIDELGPEDINIPSLIKRIKKDNINEVIMAIKSSVEADMTSLYIKKVLEKNNVVISRIASGIPIGADMDYVDSLTLESALKNRNEVL